MKHCTTRCCSSLLAAALLLGLAVPSVWAIYLRPDIEKVPVARLIENLETLIKKEPKDVQVRFNLARVHAMAFALKTDSCEIRKGQEKDGAWFGYEPRPIPFAVKKTEDAGKQDAARKHLEKAINLYEQVVKDKPDHFIAQLGRAWSIAQRASKEEAVKEYRKVIELAWNKEKDLKFAGLGFYAITSETAKYLIPLLDAEKDKDEISTLKTRSEKLDKLPRPITPIALPLRDNMTASEMIDLSARVRFDADGSGLDRTWTWIGKDAGWLVHDPKQTGKITSALQMFGSVTFWCFWDNGYQALAALDDDGDGWLRGKELEGLAVWHDANGNGISEPGEVKPLSEWGITALRCRADTGPVSAICAAQAMRGVIYRDGSVRPTFDIVLRRVMTVAEEKEKQQPVDLKKLDVPGGYANRIGAARLKAVKEKGGSIRSETAVERGLRWLALHQAPDGYWSLNEYHKHARQTIDDKEYYEEKLVDKGGKNDIAGAALGLLPFLAAGITHKSAGLEGDEQYIKTVKNGIDYLLQKQGKDGSFPGGMYAHALAAIAMCEAFTLDAEPNLKKSAQAAIDYIVAAQDPKGGGWRYQPRQPGDTSVTGWQIKALFAGKLAELTVPQVTLDKAKKYLDSCESMFKGGGAAGGFGYVPGSGETPRMSAVGLLCRQYQGTPRRNPAHIEGVSRLLEGTPPDPATKNIYYEYHATQVLFNMEGDHWEGWNKGKLGKNGMRDILIERQDKDGSWDPTGDGHGAAGGRIMQTSLSLLTLQVYYRHMPISRPFRDLFPPKK